MDETLSAAKTRLLNAKARLLEIEIAEREKKLRSVEDCWSHILRFGQAMQNLPLRSMNERDVLLAEIEKQMNISRQILESRE